MIRFFCILFSILFVYNHAFAQSDLNGNEWIDYNKNYVRIGVLERGIQKIDVGQLPDNLRTADPNSFQLWHRGKQVSLIKSTSTEILFYGEPNDGATDSLVFRPSTARLNPYISLFSNEGSYFLTNGTSPARVNTIDGTAISANAQVLDYHFQKEIKTFTDQFAFTTFGVDNLLNNSFYESSNSFTGPTIVGPSASSNSGGVGFLDRSFVLKNFAKSAKEKPELQILINGLNSGQHNVQILLAKNGKDTANMQKLGGVDFAGYQGRKIDLNLTEGEHFAGDGNGILRIRTTSSSPQDWIGLSYFTLVYPQISSMANLSTGYFNYILSGNGSAVLRITDIPVGATIYDVSIPDSPTVLNGRLTGSTFEAQVVGKPGASLRILVTQSKDALSVPAARIYKTDFNPLFAKPLVISGKPKNPSDYDFLIITHSKLEKSALEYAKYRSSDRGGNYKTLLIDIRKIYDEFNYGEPTPIAIRKFIRYMLQSGIRIDKHNLLLIGHSVSWSTRLVKEMPNEVPTFGDPGSDVLLVAGLQNTKIDIPAIPIGRINAFTDLEVMNYLSKVDDYEHTSEVAWKKNVLHLNGGHSASEITQLRDLLSDLKPTVEGGVVGGVVRQFVKQSAIEVEKVNIAPEVNAGVGMITYFGHGSQTITDLDMGYVSNVSRGYTSSGKYPLMYFNGCGVGNIFASRITQTLAGDWVVAPGKGAIGVISNSYKSYVSPSATHLKELYKQIFTGKEDKSIGQILIGTAKAIISNNPSDYDVANIHQSNLQGDPSIMVIRSAKPDYIINPEGGLSLYSESANVTIGSSKKLTLAMRISNSGRFIVDDKLPIQINYFFADGSKGQTTITANAVANFDTVFHSESFTKSIRRIEVKLDPAWTVSELSKSNNNAELEIDWNIAKDRNVYPEGVVKDLVPPMLSVYYNGRRIKNEEKVELKGDFKFVVEDDRFLPLDSSYISVYIKPCQDESCRYSKISVNELSLTQINDKSFLAKFSAVSLVEGSYQILINVSDRAGNVPTVAYSINLGIGNEDEKIVVSSSPNPASDYVKFDIRLAGHSLKSGHLRIYDTTGRLVKSFFNSTQGQSQVLELFWKTDVPSGLYIYKFEGVNQDGKLLEVFGKSVIIK